jgi:hypothetical protein
MRQRHGDAGIVWTVEEKRCHRETIHPRGGTSELVSVAFARATSATTTPTIAMRSSRRRPIA